MPRLRTPPIVPSEHMSVGGSHRQHRRSRSRSVTDEARLRARQRKGKAKWISKYQKHMAAVPGGAGSDRKPKGQVRDNEFGVLEYWKEDEQAWIPAVYHYQIRKILINRAKTCDDDVYSHPRARGKDELDITAFLDSQRTWDLERDHGWVEIPQLFDFARNHETPTYEVPWMYDQGRVVLDLNNHPVKAFKEIPLTLSSKVEGGLMEAIRRLHSRIGWVDLLARLPKHCGSGEILTPQALSGRGSRWRLRNAVSAHNVRSGTDAINGYLWEKMSQEARDANSTRELSKLSKEEQQEARKRNAGKHDANAGGWARPKKGEDAPEQDLSAPIKARKARATERASSRSGRRTRSRVTLDVDYEHRESQLTPFAPEPGRPTESNERNQDQDFTPSASHASQNTYPEAQYRDSSVNPFQNNNLVGHNYGPSSSSFSVYDMRPNEVEYLPLSAANGQNMSAGIDDVTGHIRAQAEVTPSRYFMASPTQSHSAYPIPGVEATIQQPYFNIDQQPRPNARSDPTYHAALQPPLEIDYRSLEPQNAYEFQDIQAALDLTRKSFEFFEVGKCPPTTRHQSYLYQVMEILDSFARQWESWYGNQINIPLLDTYKTPWRNGFKDYMTEGSNESWFDDNIDYNNAVSYYD